MIFLDNFQLDVEILSRTAQRYSQFHRPVIRYEQISGVNYKCNHDLLVPVQNMSSLINRGSFNTVTYYIFSCSIQCCSKIVIYHCVACVASICLIYLSVLFDRTSAGQYAMTATVSWQ